MEYIERLDIDSDVALLEQNFKVRPECLRNFKIASLLLKNGAKRGLNLAQISQILCRSDEDETAPSILEKIVEKASLCSNLKLKMQRKFKDFGISFDYQKDSWKSKSVANIFGGTIRKAKKQTAKFDPFERSLDT